MTKKNKGYKMENKQLLDMDTVARWMGYDQINLRIAQDQIVKLTEENQRLNQMLAEAKLGKEK